MVVVVSDFRGPRDWRPPLLQLAGGHDVVAVEIRDPREQELPNVGDLWLVDPETGRQLRVDTKSRKLRERFADAAAAERAELARASCASLGVAHVVLSTVGRLAAPLVGFLQTEEAAMSFAWPIAALGLLLVPLALVAYLVVQRRRRKLRGPLHEPRPARQPRRRLAALAAAPACRRRSRSLALAALIDRRSRGRRRRRRAARGGDR